MAQHISCRPEQLSLDSRIGEDLCCVGDDAKELLTAFSDTFHVDISAMDFTAYFPQEASSDMHYYLLAITENHHENPLLNGLKFCSTGFWRLFAKQLAYKSLTIGDLANAASTGKW